MILIIKHVTIEGPGTIEDFFRKEGFSIKIVELGRKERLPEDFTDMEAVVSMGGPMNVYEENKYPFLKEEDIFIKRVIKEEVPFFGVCLGSQLLAKAVGAKVRPSPKKEIGWFKVHLTTDGKNDALFWGLPQNFDIFQWHGDTFDIPLNGKHLAQAVDCEHQALKVGPCAYGLQFHIEVTYNIIENWVRQDFKTKENGLTKEGQKILSDYPRYQEIFHKNAKAIYRNFLKIMSEHKVTV